MVLAFIFKLIFNTYFQALVIVLLLLSLVLIYEKSKASQKTFKCPNCGEEINVEFMNAEYCSVCGCKLKEIGTNNKHNE